MFKHLLVILLIISCIIILPVNAADVCPPPQIYYVTVTIPVPSVTCQPSTCPPVPICPPTGSTQQSISSNPIKTITSHPEYIIVGILVLLTAAGGFVYIKRRNKKGKPPRNNNNEIAPDNEELYEDEQPVYIPPVKKRPVERPPEKKEEKPKKYKKPKSLLDQDFEF